LHSNHVRYVDDISQVRRLPMIKVKNKSGTGEYLYYSLQESARMIVKNKFGVPVDGMNSENLRRAYRDTGGKVGKTIGRNVYFTKIDLNTLGYLIDETKLDPDGVIEMGDGWSL